MACPHEIGRRACGNDQARASDDTPGTLGRSGRDGERGPVSRFGRKQLRHGQRALCRWRVRPGLVPRDQGDTAEPLPFEMLRRRLDQGPLRAEMRRYRVTPNARSPADSGCSLRYPRKSALRPTVPTTDAVGHDRLISTPAARGAKTPRWCRWGLTHYPIPGATGVRERADIREGEDHAPASAVACSGATRRRPRAPRLS